MINNNIYQKYNPEGWNENKKLYTLDELNLAKEKGLVLEGFVKKQENGNTYIDLGNDRIGIIPKNKLGIYLNNNHFVQFKIEDVKNNVYMLSRKSAQEESLNWAINELKKGEIINGIVKNIKPYGAFIDIGSGTVGLLHIEDISVARMKSPAERLDIGQRIPVIVKEINKEEKKIDVSYKEILGTWEENIKDIKVGDILDGIIKEVTKDKKGIFVELKPNLVGLSEYKSGLIYGQKVKVFVKKILPDKKKIKLIIK